MKFLMILIEIIFIFATLFIGVVFLCLTLYEILIEYKQFKNYYSKNTKKNTFSEWLEQNWENNNMFSPSIDTQVALNFLQQYLLGEDWYIVNPLPNCQANVEVVNAILSKYSKKYRKEKKLKGNKG